MLTDDAKALARAHGLGERAEAPDVIVPASYNFPHIGKVHTLSFILFAGWFAGAPVAVAEYPHLATTGVMVLFGGVTAAVPFLLDLFRIPADTFQLFLATGVINSRFGTLMAAMHTVTVAIIGTWMTAGAVTLSMRRLVRYAVISLVLAAAIVGGIRVLVARTLDSSYRGADVLLGMRMLHEQPGVVVVPAPEPAPAAGKPALARMRERGSIRVGILPDSLPYAFVNRAGELVGFDVEMAHKMARELGLRLELVDVTRDRIGEALASGRCEIVMSGVVVTTERAAQVHLSTPYLDETLAMIVPDHTRGRFVTWERARQQPSLRIGLPSMAFYAETIRAELPGATLVPFTTAEELFSGRQRFDAVMLTAERGSAWTLLHPELSVVVPMPGRVQVPLAYPVADAEMAAFVNVWIDLARKDGTIQSLYDHWILGRTAAPRVPRWSIIRNVLHWVD
jgi:ABC-type amino acid transport substrate-binding protein